MNLVDVLLLKDPDPQHFLDTGDLDPEGVKFGPKSQVMRYHESFYIKVVFGLAIDHLGFELKSLIAY